jgi:hypothetical protein
MQLSTFYNILLQLFDALIVMSVVFFDVSMVKEASFLSFCVMIFQINYKRFTPIKTNF